MKTRLLLCFAAAFAGVGSIGELRATTVRHDFKASDGVRLSYLEAGDSSAPPIVFVPGWMCPASIWAPQLDHFSRTHHVVALDPRAQGESSTRDVDDLTPERRARDVKELVERLQLREVTLVGWSMAVGELLSWVEQFGTAGVRAFVLVDGFLGREPTAESILGTQTWLAGLQTNRTGFLQGFVKFMFKTPPPAATIDGLVAAAQKTPASAAVVLMTGASLRDHRPTLARIDKPLLYVIEPMLKPEADALRERLPGATIKLMENAGHALFVEQPDEFNRLLDDFLAQAAKGHAAKPARPPIYDETAAGAEQIAAALATAKADSKRVLLMFGANWCGWCHKLHGLFASDSAIAVRLKSGYVVVLIDVNEGHNEATDLRYGRPTRHGLPVLVVLDADGRQLTTQDTGELEAGDHHDPAKVLTFLERWAVK